MFDIGEEAYYLHVKDDGFVVRKATVSALLASDGKVSWYEVKMPAGGDFCEIESVEAGYVFRTLEEAVSATKTATVGGG